jgi:Tfp pilus assembly protein PilZ
MMEDKRKYKRRTISLNVEYDMSPRQMYMESRAKDISGGGLCLITSEALAKDKEVLLKIFLPDREKPLFISGLVVWSKPYKERLLELFLNGIEFSDVKDNDRDLVIKFVDGATFQK